MRRVRIVSDGKKPGHSRVLDAESGEEIEGVSAIHLLMRAGDVPVLTLETPQPCLELDVAALAETKPESDTFEDRHGRVWLRAAALAKSIRDNGIMCEIGRETAHSMTFTESLLKEWENKPVGPSKPRATSKED